MDSIEFFGVINDLTIKPASNVTTIACGLKSNKLSEDDRDKLGLWCGMETPEIELVVTAESLRTLELSGELAGARVNLATQQMIVAMKFNRDSGIGGDDEKVLALLARYKRVVGIEIKTAQMSFGGGT